MATSLDRTATAVARQLAELAGEPQVGRGAVVVVERADARVGHVAPVVQDPALPLRRRLPGHHRRRRRAAPPRRVLRGRRRAQGRSTSASTWPTTCPSARRRRPRIARRNITRVAEQFIVGTGAGRGGGRAAPAVAAGQRVHRRPARREDGHRGRGRPLRGPGRRAAAPPCSPTTPRWAPDDHLECDDLGPLPRVNVSVKPTALAARYAPLTRADGLDQAKARLRPILRQAAGRRRLRPLRRRALRREGPHPRSCSGSCSTSPSSPASTPAS